MDRGDPDCAKDPALETPPPDTAEAAGSATAGTGTRCWRAGLCGGGRLVLGLVLCLMLALQNEFGIQVSLSCCLFFRKSQNTSLGKCKSLHCEGRERLKPTLGAAGTQTTGPCPSLW